MRKSVYNAGSSMNMTMPKRRLVVPADSSQSKQLVGILNKIASAPISTVMTSGLAANCYAFEAVISILPVIIELHLAPIVVVILMEAPQGHLCVHAGQEHNSGLC